MEENKKTCGARGLVIREPLIFETGSPGRTGANLPDAKGVDEADASKIYGDLYRDELVDFPEVSEAEAARHYNRLSALNFHVDAGLYPLGSCTMKYNPKCNEVWSMLPGFAFAHPYLRDEDMRGCLEMMYLLEEYLAEITGMDATTLQPAAGAHGEMTGLLLIAAYHQGKGDPKRKVVLVPDTAHGTNPASARLAGFDTREIKSDSNGMVAADTVRKECDETVAALMMTNPNTLGMFESEADEIAKVLHERGALLYCDGANLNAIMGITRPGDIGFDVIQLNLHKTMSTPHGGGGPGSGPVCVKKILEPYLPVPRILKNGDVYETSNDIPGSIGRVRSFFGNFGVMIKAFSYIRSMGPDGLKRASEMAVLNANYLKQRLRKTYNLPYDGQNMHEVVFDDRHLKDTGVTTMDIAKRLIDYGFHPPTVYFPLVVHGALMMEPTETETPETIDTFAETMETISREAQTDPALVKTAPHNTLLRRLDETQAARKPRLRWRRGD